MENVYHIDGEDFEDLIIQIETSFGFKFEIEELKNNITIDEFSELVISKMDMADGKECTTQIAFYKIRKALIDKLEIKKDSIHPTTELDKIFPKENRIKNWENLFKEFNYNGIDLQPPPVPYGISILTGLVSFFFMFGDYKLYAIPLFLSSVILAKLLSKYGKRFPAKSIRELTEKIVRHNYKNVRTEKGTINIIETKNLIFHHLTDWLEPRELKNMNMNTKINYLD
jgi:hypothetical protein